MRNRIAIAITACLLVASSGCAPRPVAPLPPPGPEPGGLVIEPPLAHYVHDLDPRELRDQVRDWAVLGTIAHLDATPEEAAAATYEIPPARLPYLDELYAFEHGRGRRVYHDGRVLLFRDADDPVPAATIGRLADRVRMESGELPPTVEVYAVHDVRDEGQIRVERLPDVTREALFSPAYGYVEGAVTDAASLAAWLDGADDLTSAQLTADGRLVLGGRRFGELRTANLTVDDVAALYQAHDALEQPRVRARGWLAKRPLRTRMSVERVVDLVKGGEARGLEAWTELYGVSSSVPAGEQAAVGDTIRALASDPAPGFSLDPQWVPDPANPGRPLLLSRIRAFIANPCGELQAIGRRAEVLEQREPDVMHRSLATTKAIDVRDWLAEIGELSPAVCQQISRETGPALARLAMAIPWLSESDWELAEAAYHRILRKLAAGPTADPRARAIAAVERSALGFYSAETSVQCGTYFGLQGTRVGMTLFYTDLLAKLWGMDYGRSAPTLEVPGFLPETYIDLSPSYRDELNRGTYTRLWFGPRAESVSRLGDEQAPSLLFDHRFTRIYAAGSDPGVPGVESQPDEAVRRTIGWWDRHFDEVADYEQEYHRQNQITKWSLVTAALADAGAGRFLGQVPVQRDLDFPSWYRASSDRLRFSEPLPAAPAAISGKECLPLVTSYPYETAGEVQVLSGGVTTVARGTPARVPQLRPAATLGSRRPYVADLGAGKAGTSTRALPTQAGRDVTFYRAEQVRTRAPTGDVRIGTPTVKYERAGASAPLRIQAGSEARQIGALEAKATSPSRVALRWKDGPVEQGLRNAKPAPDLATADRLGARGRLADATEAYRRLGPAVPKTANDLARQAVAEAAQLRPAPMLRTLKRLESRGAQVSPSTRAALERGVSEVGTPAAARHVSAALRAGKPLANAEGKLVVERGKIILTRDIGRLPVRPMAKSTPTDMMRAEVYVDSRLRVGREGLVHNPGGTAARTAGRPRVTIEVMDRSAIGALPDKLVVRSTGATLERATHKTVTGVPIIIVIRPAGAGTGDRPACDGEREAAGSGGCARDR